MNKTLSKTASLIFLIFFPAIILAQVPPIPGSYGGTPTQLITNVATLVLDIVWIVALTYTVVMFVLAGFKYFHTQGDPSKVSEANKIVIWGTVGVAIVVLAWSMIAVIRLQFGV